MVKNELFMACDLPAQFKVDTEARFTARFNKKNGTIIFKCPLMSKRSDRCKLFTNPTPCKYAEMFRQNGAVTSVETKKQITGIERGISYKAT